MWKHGTAIPKGNKCYLIIPHIILRIHQVSFYRLSEIAAKSNLKCVPINFLSMVKKERNEYEPASPLPKICDSLNRKMESKFIKIFYNNVFDECPKRCQTLNYYGAPEISPAANYQPKSVAFSFWFLDDEIKVETEYFILDLNGLVGFVGGTLGLFVGFSFFMLWDLILPFYEKWLSMKRKQHKRYS